MARKNARTCAHPPSAIRPGIDPRWETCSLCGFSRPAPVLAPWIEMHDAEQEQLSPDDLSDILWDIQHPEPSPAPEPVPEPLHASSGKIRERLTAREIRQRDEAILGGAWLYPPSVLLPEDARQCPRCYGLGEIETEPHVNAWLPPRPREYSRLQVEWKPARKSRTCPRCQGEGKICRYDVTSAAAAITTASA